MAIMGRTKRANAQRWNAINKQREKENDCEPKKEEKTTQITQIHPKDKQTLSKFQEEDVMLK